MMISDEQVRRAVDYLRTSDEYVEPVACRSDPGAIELVDRVVEALRGSLEAFDARVHALRGHRGQRTSAGRMRALLAGSAAATLPA